MKKFYILLTILGFSGSSTFAQPTYYYFDPPNAGVNNLYLNTAVSYKFIFTFTQAEMAATGMSGPMQINSLWLKSNTAYNLMIQNFKITLGHSTQSVPADIFADNFDAGSPVVVLEEPVYLWQTLAGPWNDPASGWTEIPLTSPFVYNFTDHFVVQGEYTNINYPIPLYANNGGIPVAKYTDTIGGVIATDFTARPMIGFSTNPASPLEFAASDSTVCQKLCVDFTDFSNNNPVAWSWTFEEGTPSSSTDQNPTQICYNIAGTFDVTLITTDSNGKNDTLVYTDFINVYATPAIPVITQIDDSLISTPAPFYQWQHDGANIPGATAQSYVATVTGFYSVVVMDSAGCISQSSTLFIDITGLEQASSEEISVFPNPAFKSLSVNLTNGLTDQHCELFILNNLGQKVFSTEEISRSNYFDVSFLENGVYILEIRSEKISLKEKVMIMK